MISVCIPTYNGAKYLEDCLDSVLSQTLEDIEILVVDDGSTDVTYNILECYAARDQRIRLYRNDQNLGLVGNWNRCIELARGEWVKFVFQDDLIAPTCLESMLAVSQPDTALVVCRRDFLFDEATGEDARRYYLEHPAPDTVFDGNHHISAQDVCEKVFNNIGVNIFGEPTAVLMRRNVFSRYGLFNPDLIMVCDTEYWTRVASHTGFMYLPETLASFRVHAGSTSAYNFSRRQYRMIIDGLVLLHNYAFDDVYAALREAVLRSDPDSDFTLLLTRKVPGARWVAMDAAYRKIDPDSTLLEEWNQFLQHYPRISDLLPKRDDIKPGMLARFRKWHFGGRLMKFVKLK